MKSPLFLIVLVLSLTKSFAVTNSYSFPPGYTFFATHVNVVSNRLGDLLPSPPDSSSILKWNCAAQDFDVYTYDTGFGGWVDAGFSPASAIPLVPGQGAIFWNPEATNYLFILNGSTNAPTFPPPTACGGGKLSLLGRQLPATATYDDIIGAAPYEGVRLFKHIPGQNPTSLTSSNYTIYTFSGGGWAPSAPSIAVGSSVWIDQPCLSVLCPTNKTVPCDSLWSFNSPVVDSNCCLTNYIAVTSTTTNGLCPRIATRSWIISADCDTNVVYCSQLVTLVDSVAPTISGLTNKTVNCGETWSFDSPTISDACCGTNYTFVVTTVTNTTSPLVITRTWQATDCCTNVSTNSQTVTVLSNCCLTISGEVITATTNCTFTYKFTVRNDTADVVSYVSLTATNGSYVFSQPLTFLSPPLQPGQSRQITQTISGTSCSQICFYVGLHNATLAECCSELHCITLPDCCNQSVTYSTAAHFTNNGVLMNLIYTNGALRFPTHTQPFPYVYIACSGRGTIVKIDINNGNVLGEYKTAPTSGSNPSRTTVDLRGNVWVANRNPINGKGTVTRIALVIGGTRVDANGTPNPTGQYLKPPFLYNSGAVDRHGATLSDPPDGLIKTSRGLGNILPWSGPEPVNGAAATADDECVINYTVVGSILAGIRTVAVDRNNDVWVGCIGGAHQKLSGVTGLPVGSSFSGAGLAGGYGGLVDGNNVLWSARGAGQKLLRVDLGTIGGGGPNKGADLGAAHGDYGISIDPCTGNIWHVSVSGDRVSKWSPAGIWLNDYNAQNPNNILTTAQGLAVDESQNVWIAHSHASPNNSVGHINTSGAAVGLGYVTLPGTANGPTGVAVDAKGNVWVSCYNSSKAMRINPTLGIGGVGAVDIVVDLNAAGGLAATPYNYSDKAGYIAVGVTSPSGFWDFVHSSCGPGTEWGSLSWTACPGTEVKVEVRAADKVTDLPGKTWRTVKNGSSFCGGFFTPTSIYPAKIKGQHLEVRVTLKRGTASPCDPSIACLQSLSIKCCRPTGPDVVWGPGGGNIGPLRLTNNFSFNTNLPVVLAWDGQPIVLTWSTNGVPTQTNDLSGGFVATNATVDFIRSYPSGSNLVELVVSGADFDPLSFESYVIVGDNEPPVWSNTVAVSTVAYSATVPNLIAGLTANDVADDWTLFGDLLKLQDIPAGTVVTQSFQMVALSATDEAGNTSTNHIPFSLAPVLTITSPVSYSDFLTTSGMPITIQIASNITDVAQVRYYLSGTLVATSLTPPFGLSVTNPVAGSYQLQAEAVSSGGLISITPGVLISFSLPEPVNIQVSTSGGITLSWPAGGWFLQSAPQLTGPWNNVPGATNPYVPAMTNSQQFYRLKQ